VTNQRLGNRQLVGVKYDEHSKSWSTVTTGHAERPVRVGAAPHKKK
jgi:hypothetical protein